jgi:hypothetical protein
MFASKGEKEVSLQKDFHGSSPFNHWKKNLLNERMLIASIPFLRNLAEYSGDKVSKLTLTSLLHVKADTNSITVGQLEGLIKKILQDQSSLTLANPTTGVKDLIEKVATQITGETSETHALEDKIVLSMAIRLKAEDVMIQKINDNVFWAGIKRNQTVELIGRFKKDFPAEKAAIQLFEQVNLMTPENIHLNSFMYEPILDLSAHHLRKLYLKVLAIK